VKIQGLLSFILFILRRWFRLPLGKKQRVLRNSGPCYQDCWHTDRRVICWLNWVSAPSLAKSATNVGGVSFLCKSLGRLGLLLWVDLINWVSNVRPYIRPSTKSFFDFNEICYVGRGRWVMHDGMQYDPI